MDDRAKISRDQELTIQRSMRNKNPFRIFRELLELVKSGNEPIDSRWRPIWEAVRSDVVESVGAPEHMIDEIDEAIQRIELIDERIWQLDLQEEDTVCLLLGAGASAPEPSAIPTVMQLLPELWRRAGKIGREDIDRLANWCNEHSIKNIEDLLTAAYLANFAAKNPNVSDLLDYFLFRAGAEERGRSRERAGVTRVNTASVALLQDTLQVLFSLLTSTMIPASPNLGHEAITNFVKEHKHSSIVTTNYDGCMDEQLIHAGIEPNTNVDESKVVPANGIDLVKIHGSINWSYCESCHEVRDFDIIRLKKAYQEDTATYAVIGICKNCGGQRRPLLIPPLGFKFIIFPNLIKLWNSAREKIESANYIVVVGFSFSEADTYINKIIERSMTRHDDQRMIVCDPNAHLVQSLRNRFSARIDDFEESRILAANGSADKVVPKVLQRLTQTADVENVAPLPAPKRERTKARTEKR